MELAAGLLVSLPTLAGGLVLAPRPARAEDGTADSTDASELAGLASEYVVIDVVEPWEVGFMVVDVSKGTKNDAGMVSYSPVAGAHVAVTSRFNGKTAEGTTDDAGIANIDIRELAVGASSDVSTDGPGGPGPYYFNGSVTVSCDGYREFRTALISVTGGTGLQVPAHPLDDESPYPYLVSFDEWDALYSKNEFLVSPKNTDDHTIDVELLGIPAASAVTVELWVHGEKQACMSAQATPGESVQVGVKVERVAVGLREVHKEIYDEFLDHTFVIDGMEPVYEMRGTPIYGRPATATFTAPFLKQGDAACLPVGGSLDLVVKQGTTTWTIPLAVTLLEAVVPEPTGKEANKGQPLTLINTQKGGSIGVGAFWPQTVPVVGGNELKFWSPALPINVYLNPFGLIQFTLEVPLWGYRNDKGDDEPHDWGHYPYKTVEEQWARKVKTLKSMTDKSAGLISKPGAVQQIDLFKNVTVDINFRLLALAQWRNDKGLYQGEVAGQILAALNFTITENFFAGPIPVLITFAFDASLIFALSAASYTTKITDKQDMASAVLDFSRWKWDYENTGFTMTLNLTPSLSVGVGLRGVASISVKGTITLTLFFGVPMGTQPAGLDSPHFSAGWSAQISLVIELFLFTQSFALFTQPFSNFYDSWNGKNLTKQAEAEALGALADKSVEELLSDLVPITDEMLAQTSEASVDGQGLVGQAEGVQRISFSWDDAARTEYTDERTGLTCVRYSWETGVEEPVVAAGEETGAEEPVAALAAETSAEEPVAAAGEDTDADAAGEPAVVVAAETVAEVAEGEAAESVTAEALEPETPEALEPETPALETPEPLEPQSQPEPEPEPALVPAAAPDVTWLTAQADVALPQLGVASLGTAGGIRPSSDVRIFGTDDRHVFGAARAKTVTFGTNEATGTDGGTWIFRLASVEVAGNMRTRVVANCLNGPKRGASRVVEFDTSSAGVSHDDLYDYDFDVVGGYEQFTEKVGYSRSFFYLQLVVVSGRRANAASATLAESATDLVFSNVLFVDELEFKHWFIDSWDPDAYNAFAQAAKAAEQYYGSHQFFDATRMPLTIANAGSKVLDQNTDLRHSIMSVQLQWCKTTWLDSILGPFYFVTTFLDRSSATAADTLRDDAQVHLGTFLTAWGLGDSWALPLGPHVLMPNEHSIAVDDGSTYEQTLSLYRHELMHASYDWSTAYYFKDVYFFLIMLRGAKQVHYLSMYLNVETVSDNSREFHVYNHATSAGDLDPSIRLVPCPAQGYFLASYPADQAELSLPADQRDYASWTLHKVTCVNSGDYDAYEDIDSFSWHRWNANLEFEPIGPSGFNVVNFAVNPAGTFLFWPHTRNADEDRVWNAEGREDVRERPAVYQIMACRIRGEHFSDPFVLADLSNDTDALVVIETNESAAAEMLRTVYVDTGEKNGQDLPIYHAADIWYTAVPAVRCVTATACEAVNPFVAPGGTISFHVAVRNDGNTFLSGCTLELCAYDEETDAYARVEGASAQVTFGKDTIQESAYNRSDDGGGLSNLEDDYALAPGKTSVYAVTVTVPNDWTAGEKKVLFVASEGVVAADLTAQAEGDGLAALDAGAVEFHVEPGEYQVVQVRTHAEQDPAQRHMDTLIVSRRMAGGLRLQSAPVAVSKSGESGNEQARGGGRLPQTGDGGVPGGVGLAGAGLAALGAAVATYERRRAENEARGH